MEKLLSEGGRFSKERMLRRVYGQNTFMPSIFPYPRLDRHLHYNLELCLDNSQVLALNLNVNFK